MDRPASHERVSAGHASDGDTQEVVDQRIKPLDIEGLKVKTSAFDLLRNSKLWARKQRFDASKTEH